MNSTPDQPGPEQDPQAQPAFPPAPGTYPPAPNPGYAAPPQNPGYSVPPQDPAFGQPAPGPAYAQPAQAHPGYVPQTYGYGAPAPVRRLFGWSFGAWIGVGIGLGVIVPVVLFFVVNAIDAAVNGYSTGGALTAVLIAFAVTAVAGIVCMFWPQSRGLGTGLLISIAAAPVVFFGVCVVALNTGAL